MISKDQPMNEYQSGDLVYLLSPQTSQLKTSSRNFKVKFVVPVLLHKIIDRFQYILMDIEHIIFPFQSIT